MSSHTYIYFWVGHAWIYRGGGKRLQILLIFFAIAKGSIYNTISQYLLIQLKRTFIPYPSNDQPFSYRLKYKEFLKGVLCYERGGGGILRVATDDIVRGIGTGGLCWHNYWHNRYIMA